MTWTRPLCSVLVRYADTPTSAPPASTIGGQTETNMAASTRSATDTRVPREYSGITKRTRALLARQEGLQVDFKKTQSAVTSGDLVSLANSPAGGTILVGVEEVDGDNGLQRGEIVGCSVDDSAKLTIVNKAQDCTPPIHVELYVENLGAGKPLMRVEVSPKANPFRPYCTKKGEYRTRVDGRNAALSPPQLLALFMEQEAHAFVQRFREAAHALERDVQEMEMRLQYEVEGVLGVAADATDLSEQAMASSEEATIGVRGLERGMAALSERVYEIDERVLALLRHAGVEDPIEAAQKRATRAQLESNIEEYLCSLKDKQPAVLSRLIRQATKNVYGRIPAKEDIEALARQVASRMGREVK